MIAVFKIGFWLCSKNVKKCVRFYLVFSILNKVMVVGETHSLKAFSVYTILEMYNDISSQNIRFKCYGRNIGTGFLRQKVFKVVNRTVSKY